MLVCLLFQKLLWILLCFAISAALAGTKGDETDLIIRTIMSNYEKDAHPNSNNENGAVSVQIGISPLSLNIDEEKSVLTTHIWLALAWQDKRLIWDKRQHQNISKVHLSPDRVWKPDIRLFNSVIHEDYEATDVVVYNYGMLFWVPPVTTYTTCELDYSYWPWDIQKCSMVIGSWTKSGWEIDVVNMNKQNVTDIHLTNFAQSLWEVVSAKANRQVKTYAGIDAPWPAITVDLTLRRLSFVDRKLAVLPLILVSCLTLATFWTHPSSSHRIRLGCLNLFILVFVLIQARNHLPMAGSQLPLVVSFAGSLAVLVTIQLLVALSVVNLVSRSDSPPSFLIWPLQGTLGNFLCLSDLPLIGQVPDMPGFSIDVEALRTQQAASASSEAESKPTTPPKEETSSAASSNSLIRSSKNDFSGWNLLCQAIDRVLFISYLAIILLFIASYLGGAALAAAQATLDSSSS